VNSGNFFAELKRRNVYKVAVAYVVVGGCSFKLRPKFFRSSKLQTGRCDSLCLQLLLGFLSHLVIAWAFELAPQGLKSTEDVETEQFRLAV